MRSSTMFRSRPTWRLRISITARLSSPAAILERFDRALNGRQRRSQLMGGIDDEVPLDLLGPPDGRDIGQSQEDPFSSFMAAPVPKYVFSPNSISPVTGSGEIRVRPTNS